MIVLLPTCLSLLRIALGVWGIFVLQAGAYKLSLLILVMATLSDIADGFVARYFNCVTNFGAILDPLADKIFIFCFLWVFYKLGILPNWFCWFVFVKEAAMIALGMFSVIFKDIILKASLPGKLNMAVIMALYLLIHLGLVKFGSAANWSSLFNFLVQVGIYICTVTGIYATMSYWRIWLSGLKRRGDDALLS